MTLAVKDANGDTQTIKINDDLVSSPGTSSSNPITVQGHASGVPIPVGIISGQNGVAGGAGAVGAGVQRVTLASDDPAVVALQAIDDWDESDRAKVNVIAGQAGIAAGAGAVGANTPRVTLASDDPAVTQTTTAATKLTAIAKAIEGDYETVGASVTDQVMGGTGAAGDVLSAVLIVPATTSPGAVSIKDGSGSAITIFTGGASSVSNLVPFLVPLGLVSTSGAWKITTGISVSVIGIGSFSA